jgi:hypothetical protein
LSRKAATTACDRAKVSDLLMRWSWCDLLMEFMLDDPTTRAKLVRQCNR